MSKLGTPTRRASILGAGLLALVVLVFAGCGDDPKKVSDVEDSPEAKAANAAGIKAAEESMRKAMSGKSTPKKSY